MERLDGKVGFELGLDRWSDVPRWRDGGGAGDQGTEVIEAAAGKLLGGKSLMRTCVC